MLYEYFLFIFYIIFFIFTLRFAWVPAFKLEAITELPIMTKSIAAVHLQIRQDMATFLDSSNLQGRSFLL